MIKLRAFLEILGFWPQAPKKRENFSRLASKLGEGFSPQEKFEGFLPRAFQLTAFLRLPVYIYVPRAFQWSCKNVFLGHIVTYISVDKTPKK